jgi:glycosyltransferase involved in cell wall biosynthesis
VSGARPKLVVGIPAYNAERRIGEVMARIRQSLASDAILVVDDGSRDRTAEIVAGFQGVTLIRHGENRGYGAAQKTLCAAFVDDPRFGDDDILVFIHADGEMRAEEIQQVCRPLLDDPAVDMVFGSRDVRLSRRRGFVAQGQRRPVWKRVIDRGSTAVLNALFGLDVSTYFGGFRAMRKRAVVALDVGALESGHIFDQQLVAYGGALTTMVEVPISNVENGSISSYSLARAGLRLARFAVTASEFRRRVRARGRR